MTTACPAESPTLCCRGLLNFPPPLSGHYDESSDNRRRVAPRLVRSPLLSSYSMALRRFALRRRQ